MDGERESQGTLCCQHVFMMMMMITGKYFWEECWNENYCNMRRILLKYYSWYSGFGIKYPTRFDMPLNQISKPSIWYFMNILCITVWIFLLKWLLAVLHNPSIYILCLYFASIYGYPLLLLCSVFLPCCQPQCSLFSLLFYYLCVFLFSYCCNLNCSKFFDTGMTTQTIFMCTFYFIWLTTFLYHLFIFTQPLCSGRIWHKVNF